MKGLCSNCGQIRDRAGCRRCSRCEATTRRSRERREVIDQAMYRTRKPTEPRLPFYPIIHQVYSRLVPPPARGSLALVMAWT